MDLLSMLSWVAILAGALVGIAGLVAGWELLRQREALDRLRRDREYFAATSPLPLVGARPVLAAAPRPAGAAPERREPSWIATRPAVLNPAPAVDDETATRRYREVDLALD